MAKSRLKRPSIQVASDAPAPDKAKIVAHLGSLERQIAELESLNVADLRATWVDCFGGRPPPIQSADVLGRLIAWKLQSKALGGLDAETGMRLSRIKSAMAKGKEAVLSPSVGLGVGTILTREWKGKEHRVLVLDRGYEHQGQTYGSLSMVARAITGTQWSGPRFFGLEVGQAIAQGPSEGAEK